MLREVSPPFAQPVTLAELKTHLRQSPTLGSSEDAYLESLIEAATKYAENYCGRPFVPRVVDLIRPAFAVGFEPQPLEIGSVLRVVSVTYRDPGGDAQSVLSTDYRLLRGEYASHLVPVYGFGWPSTEGTLDAVTIRMVAGYESATSPEGADGVPKSIKQAILLIAADLYENREAIIVGTIKVDNDAVHRMLHFYRVELP